MNALPNPQYCGCRLLGTRWITACRQHEAQYIALSGMVLRYYEQMRRNTAAKEAHS